MLDSGRVAVNRKTGGGQGSGWVVRIRVQVQATVIWQTVWPLQKVCRQSD